MLAWGSKPEFWDLDEDGKIDILVGDLQGYVSVYINEDTGNNVDPKFLSRLPLLADGVPLDAGGKSSTCSC